MATNDYNSTGEYRYDAQGRPLVDEVDARRLPGLVYPFLMKQGRVANSSTTVTTLPAGWDATGYLSANPDVQAHWDNNVNGIQSQAKTADAWARQHYVQHGIAEGRTGGAPAPNGGYVPYQAPAAGAAPADAQTAAPSQTQQRSDDLYNVLVQRATQSLDVNRDDPAFRGQREAFAAAQERARRAYLADVAESSGPLANLRGEQRLSYERAGQNIGGFEANLVATELQRRRDEIASALTMQAQYLTAEQQRELTERLAEMDRAIQLQQMQIADSQFGARLGFDREQADRTYDLMRRGIYPGQQQD
jgi:hypothetical protein